MDPINLTDEQKEFNKVFESIGGILIPPDDNLTAYVLNDQGPKIIDWVRRHNLEYPECNFGIINNNTVDAKARITKDGKYFIGINSGAINCITDLFNRLLAHPDVLVKYGNPALENPTTEILDIDLIPADIYIQYVSPAEPKLPNCPLRRDLAQFLIQTTLKMLLMHEYTHVKNGHLAWLQSKREEESMMEAFESNNLSSGNITMQALEMDADSIAINLLLMEVEVFFKYPEYIPLAYIPFFDNMETIGLMLFSVECFFSIFGSIEWSFTDLANYKHPPAPIRRSMMKATVYAYFEQYFPHSIESLLNQSNNVLYEVEMGFSKISGQNVNASSLKLSADTESIDHVHNIMEAWKKVREELLPYTKAPLAL